MALGRERVKGDSFLTLSSPRGLPLTSKLKSSGVRQSKIFKWVSGGKGLNKGTVMTATVPGYLLLINRDFYDFISRFPP